MNIKNTTNVLLIVVDTLRADHLGCYGYHRNTSPNIDKLAREGVLFSNAYPSDVPTQPSFTSMLSGQRGITTGVVSHDPEEDLSNGTWWLPQFLGEKGLTTAAVSTLYSFRRWFAKGFEYYMNPAAGRPMWLQQVDADEINAKAIPWIKQNRDKQFFLFVHYWDPHAWYHPPERYRRLYYEGDPSDPNNHSLDPAKEDFLQWPLIKQHLVKLGENITDLEYVIAQYDGEITYADEKIGELLEALEEAKIKDETMIILTSDHGESMNEHGSYFGHGDLYEPVVRVPLILKHPRLPEGKKVNALVQGIDIAPTILNALNMPKLKELEGDSLLSLASGEIECRREVYADTALSRAARMVRTERWKYIENVDFGIEGKQAAQELYDLKGDPKENCNLVEEEPELTSQFELHLHRWVKSQVGTRADPLRLVVNRGLPWKRYLRMVGVARVPVYEPFRAGAPIIPREKTILKAIRRKIVQFVAAYDKKMYGSVSPEFLREFHNELQTVETEFV